MLGVGTLDGKGVGNVAEDWSDRRTLVRKVLAKPSCVQDFQQQPSYRTKHMAWAGQFLHEL